MLKRRAFLTARHSAAFRPRFLADSYLHVLGEEQLDHVAVAQALGHRRAGGRRSRGGRAGASGRRGGGGGAVVLGRLLRRREQGGAQGRAAESKVLSVAGVSNSGLRGR